MPAKVDVEAWVEKLRVVPKVVIEHILGRYRSELDAIAERWGFPLGGAPCDLTAVLRRLSDFLKKYGPMLKVLMEDEGSDGDENALGVRYLRAKIEKTQQDALAQRLRNEQKQQRLCDLATITASLGKLSDRIAKAGDRAQTRWGREGLEFFQDLSAGFEADLRGVFDAIGTDAGNADVAGDSATVRAVDGAASGEADSAVR